MFGMEKKRNGPHVFDLEVDIKKDPNKAQELIKTVDAKIAELKNLLRQGSGSKDFEEYGVILQGYVALQRVLKRITAKK